MPIEIGKPILRFRSSFEPAAVGRRVTIQRRRMGQINPPSARTDRTGYAG